MKQLIYGSLALAAIVGLVAALVHAQDAPLQQTNSGISATNDLSQRLRAAGRSITNEFAANDTRPPAGTLQSVLKRNSEPEPEPRMASRPEPGRLDTVIEADYSTDLSPRLSSRRLSSRRIERQPIGGANETLNETANETTPETTEQSPSDVQPNAIEPIIAKPVGSGPTDQSLTEIGKMISRTAETLASSFGPLLRVDTVGPKAITIGEQSSFVVTVSNRADSEATNLVVRVGMPAELELVSTNATSGNPQMQRGADGIERLVWTVDQIPARSEKQLRLNVVPHASRALDIHVDWALLPTTTTARIVVQQPQLKVALAGPKDVLFGETKIYKVLVSNPGTGDAKNVTVNLALGNRGADTLRVGVIPAGERKEFDIEVTAREKGLLQIVASATGAGNLHDEVIEQISVRRANLELEPLGPRMKFAGSVGTYRVKVVNSGDATAHGVQAAVRLPQGARYLKGIESAKQIGDALTWEVGELPPSGERVYQFFCELTAGGNSEFKFGARSTGGLEVAANVVTVVEAIADLKLTVNDPKGPIPVGEAVTYEVKIINRGLKAAANVNVLSQFSDGLEPIEAHGSRHEILPGQVVFHPIERIVPGETVTLTIKAKAEKGGNHIFRAEVKCEQPITRLIAEDSTRFFGEDILTRSGVSNAAPMPASPSSDAAPVLPTPASEPDPPSIYSGFGAGN